MLKSVASLERVIFDAASQGMIIVDARYQIIEVNRWFIDSIDLCKSEMVGKSLFKVFTFEREQFIKQTINQACKSGLSSFLSNSLHPRLFPLLNRYQNCSRYMDQSCYIKPIRFDNQSYCLIQVQDVSNTVAREKLLSKTSSTLNLFKTAVEHSASSIVITDHQGIIEYVNPKFVEIAGFSQEEALGRSYFALSSLAHEPQFQSSVMQTLQQKDSWHGERSFVTKSGVKYWVNEFIYQARNSNNVPSNLIAIQDDVTQIRDIARKASYQASHDSLTGLINRKEFDSVLIQNIEMAEQTPAHVLCFLDIDQFKVVNDTSGHGAGDELLRQISVVINENYPEEKVLARLGGDEFAILLYHTDLEVATQQCEHLIYVLHDFRFRWEEAVFSIGISIGITLINEQTISSIEAIKQAENACDAAKDMGRNRVYIYQEDDSALVQRQGDTYWATKINEALEDDLFVLYAQPIVPLQHKSKISYEILVRIHDGEGGVIPPGLFLPAAERFNLSHRIDRWVIDNTLKWMMNHGEEIDHVEHISINLSGLTLSNETLLNYILELVTSSKIAPRKISFEITETAAIANLVQAKHFIDTLKKLGCQFALDDFGSGLSSFAYLKNLNVDMLKIDGMFVKDMIDDAIDEAMVKSINDVGHVMGMETIAEFVEDDDIKNRLIELGVDYGQGYGLGKPVPIDQIVLKSVEIA